MNRYDYQALEFFSGSPGAETLTKVAMGISVKNTHATNSITLTINYEGSRTFGPITIGAGEAFDQKFEPFSAFTIGGTGTFEAYTVG